MNNKRIPVAVPNFLGNEKKYVDDCMDTTWISSNGKYIKEFEDSFAKFLGSRNALSCSNGTVALHLPLIALGAGPGDEVLVPSFTYIATANAVAYCGAKPVLVDCLPDTWNIDPEDMRRKITSKTKGVIPVHLYGNPCDMDAVMAVAKEHGLFVVEDAAECHGATYKGRCAGTFGDMGTFSFFGNKIITTGEGGMIITDNDELAQKMRQLKGQGMDPNRRYWFTERGYNYRMTNIEAAIGLAQLERIEEHIANRRKVAGWYQEELAGMQDYLSFQAVTPHAESVWWMFSILLTEKSSVSRDALMEKLDGDGIETRPLFYPMHVMPVYADAAAACPVSEQVAASGMNLPTHAMLTREDVRYICGCIKKHIGAI
ncbi:MAG: DegT/DnrJ/EryC1/StrS family aminotransferase [Provencibacterium sp.]|nr:DegT/DnrJ/EryC1/StrS family aminotransferase [Provencibacterium sp.]